MYIMSLFLIPRPRDAIAAVTKRFAHRNANVQLYALTVWLMLIQTNSSLLRHWGKTAVQRYIER
jgi:hypothetical protein